MSNRLVDGPKNQQTDPTDQKCVLCEKWFTIFQVDYTSVKVKGVSTFVYVCHHDRLDIIRSAVEAKLNNPSPLNPCLRCQPGGDLQATCTCGAIQHHNEVVHPRHERCGTQHAYGACKLV